MATKEERELTAAEGNKIIDLLQNVDEEMSEPSNNDIPVQELDPFSPKIYALLDKINEMEHDEKCVIFSQWTSFLVSRKFRNVGTMTAQ